MSVAKDLGNCWNEYILLSGKFLIVFETVLGYLPDFNALP